MTKSVLTGVLNGFITAVVNITKHRNANNAIVDCVYSDPVYESGDIADAGYTVPSSPVNYLYNTQLTKIGRRIFIEGYIENDSGVNAPSNSSIFTFPETVDGQPNEYYPDDAFDFRGEGTQLNMNTKTKIIITGGVFRIEGNFLTSANNKYHFQMSYNAKN